MEFTPMPFKQILVALLFVAVPVAATAETPAGIAERVSTMMPGDKPDSVKPMAIEGLYEVRFGASIVYMSEDGRYLIQGRILDFEDNRNLTEEAQLVGRRELLAGLKRDDLVVYTPENPRHAVTVFTDIDCGFCRKFHNEIAELNSNGIEVRYAAFPRAGAGSDSWQKAVDVWCADDRQAAMDRAKAGKDNERKTCNNPVTAQLELGAEMGVNGTPTIFLDGGAAVVGYRSAAELAALVEEAAATR